MVWLIMRIRGMFRQLDRNYRQGIMRDDGMYVPLALRSVIMCLGIGSSRALGARV